MNTNEDLRVKKTKKLIKDSFLELLEEKGYSKVTVTDITNRAMINRNTFYLHYVDKEDLIDKLIFDTYKEKETKITNIIMLHVLNNFRNQEKLQELILYDIINFFLEEINFYRIFLRDPGLDGYINKLKNTIKRSLKSPFINSVKRNVSFEFIFEGTFGVLTEWIKNDFVSKEDLTREMAIILNSNWNLIFDESSVIDIINYIKNKK